MKCPFCESSVSVTDNAGNPWFSCGSKKYFRSSSCLDREPLATELRNAKDRVKRLEEALTEIELAMKQPASNHRLMQIAGPARQVINIIKKAKEAKL